MLAYIVGVFSFIYFSKDNFIKEPEMHKLGVPGFIHGDIKIVDIDLDGDKDVVYGGEQLNGDPYGQVLYNSLISKSLITDDYNWYDGNAWYHYDDYMFALKLLINDLLVMVWVSYIPLTPALNSNTTVYMVFSFIRYFSIKSLVSNMILPVNSLITVHLTSLQFDT